MASNLLPDYNGPSSELICLQLPRDILFTANYCLLLELSAGRLVDKVIYIYFKASIIWRRTTSMYLNQIATRKMFGQRVSRQCNVFIRYPQLTAGLDLELPLTLALKKL
jgi:hypothetical protein